MAGGQDGDHGQGLARGLTNYGDRDFSLYLRRSFAKSMGYSDEMLARPVVGIANSAIPEVVGDAGVVIDSPDVEQLAAAIESLVTDPGLGAELSRRGIERAARFSWAETARQTREVYRRVAAEA